MLIDVGEEEVPRTDFMKYSNTELCPVFDLQRSESESKIYKLNAHLMIKDIIAFVNLLETGTPFKPPSLDFLDMDAIDANNKLVSCIMQYFDYVDKQYADDERLRSVKSVIEEQLGEKETRKMFSHEKSRTCCCS